MNIQKISPFLWFNGTAESAVEFYCSVFKNGRIINASKIPVQGGEMYTATFSIEGQEFMALDGGPMFTFSQATSFFIKCDNQQEIDYYWNKLSEGGTEQQCGWLIDQFGVSWQVVPTVLGQLMDQKNPKKAVAVINAFMQMKKFDLSVLEEAYKNN